MREHTRMPTGDRLDSYGIQTVCCQHVRATGPQTVTAEELKPLGVGRDLSDASCQFVDGDDCVALRSGVAGTVREQRKSIGQQSTTTSEEVLQYR